MMLFCGAGHRVHLLRGGRSVVDVSLFADHFGFGIADYLARAFQRDLAPRVCRSSLIAIRALWVVILLNVEISSSTDLYGILRATEQQVPRTNLLTPICASGAVNRPPLRSPRGSAIVLPAGGTVGTTDTVLRVLRKAGRCRW